MRTVARVDANQAEIVSALRQVGAYVLHLHQLKNCFDILVGYRGRTFLMEIKATEKDQLTPGEAKFREDWRGSPYHVVYTADQAIKIITTLP